MNGGSLRKDHVRNREFHHRVFDFERDGAISCIPEICESGVWQSQLDLLLSVLFVGGYVTTCHTKSKPRKLHTFESLGSVTQCLVLTQRSRLVSPHGHPVG